MLYYVTYVICFKVSFFYHIFKEKQTIKFPHKTGVFPELRKFLEKIKKRQDIKHKT